MAGVGRGRGWGGRGGGASSYAPQLPYVILPEGKFDEIGANVKHMINWGMKFQNYWKAAPYHFLEEETNFKEGKGMHIERFSDRQKNIFTRGSLSQVLMFDKFAKELVQGTSKQMPSQKKFRWNPESAWKTLDLLEQQEKKFRGREDKDEKEKKDGEDEEEKEEDEEGE